MSTETLKKAAIVCFVIAMGGLLLIGLFANREAPPYPGRVVGPDGSELFTRADILAGQDVYQRYGLMDHGSVWGHGSQRGMEFSALTLHRVGENVKRQLSLDEYGLDYPQLTEEERDLIDIRTRRTLKANNYDAGSDTLRLNAPQVAALRENAGFWEKIFRDGSADYGFLPETIPTQEERKQLARFFYWTAWVASTTRPGSEYSYTNN